MENYEDNNSDSDDSSDEFDDDADVLRATIELMSIADNGGEVDNGCGTWNYKAHSQRGGEMYAGLPTQLSPPGDTTKVLYRPSGPRIDCVKRNSGVPEVPSILW
eukprot:scaffold14232_cov69-Skeletonema_dohrnii-CCMP3373.AAC.1